jgi:hypothetical protein
MLGLIFNSVSIFFFEFLSDAFGIRQNSFLPNFSLLPKAAAKSLEGECYRELPYPTNNTEIIIVITPINIVPNVFLLTPLHSCNVIPHKLEIIIMKAMCKIHELAPFPSLLSPIP